MAALHITQKRMREPDSMKKVIFGFTQSDTFTEIWHKSEDLPGLTHSTLETCFPVVLYKAKPTKYVVSRHGQNVLDMTSDVFSRR